jgi:hypothetical protein
VLAREQALVVLYDWFYDFLSLLFGLLKHVVDSKVLIGHLGLGSILTMEGI